MSKVDIVTFAKDVMNKHLFDYEKDILENYEEKMEWNSFYEWVKPPIKNQYLMTIWLSYQKYLNGTFDIETMKMTN